QAPEVRPWSTAAATSSATLRNSNGLRRTPKKPSRTMSGEEDDGHGDAGPPECSENVNRGKAGDNHVDKDDLRLECSHSVECPTTILNRGHPVTLAGEEVA